MSGQRQHDLDTRFGLGSLVHFVLALSILVPGSAPLRAGSPVSAELGDFVPHSAADIFIDPPIPATFQGIAYFHNDDGIHGRELWQSDGTVLGTHLLLDLCPGDCGVNALLDHRQVAVAGTRLLFLGNDGIHGLELWSTDGTPLGTVLVRDLRPGLYGSTPNGLTTVGSRVYFWANDGDGFALWVTDGSTNGPRRLLAHPVAPSNSSAPVAIDLGELLIFGFDYPLESPGLWRSDGTIEGTYKLATVAPFQQNFATNSMVARVGGRIVFWGNDADFQYDPTLWVTDGTVEGTGELASLPDPFPFAASVNYVYFGTRNELSQDEIWRTDGTTSGTVRLFTQTENFGHMGLYYGRMATIGDQLVFSRISEEHGLEPWIWDGEKARLLLDVRPGPESSLAQNPEEIFVLSQPPLFSGFESQVIFFADDGVRGVEAWRTDGTPEGTRLVRDLVPGNDGILLDFEQGILTPGDVDSGLLVRLRDAAAARSLVLIDGSVGGIEIVAALEDQASAFDPSPEGSAPFTLPPFDSCFQPVGDSLLFSPNRLGWGREPHGLDVETLSVDLIADFYPGPFGANAGSCNAISGVGLFGANDSTTASLFATTGQPGNYSPLAVGFGSLESFANSNGWAEMDDRLFFTLQGKLWRSDGTPEGTLELAALEDYYPTELKALGATLFVAGFGLHRTDGEPGEIVQLTSSKPAEYPYPNRLTPLAATLLFSGWSSESGQELWRSDGSADGTWMLRDIRPGPKSGLDEAYVSYRKHRLLGPVSLESGSPIAVFAADDGTHGEELWRSDGTFEGTAQVSDIINGPYPSSPRWLTRFGSHVYFVAESHGKGRELWRTDGTEQGTELVADLVKGPGSSLPENLHAAGSELYFSAWTPARGREAWRIRLDGSKNPQPVPLDEIAPGALSSSPQIFREIGGTVFTVANDNVHGFELWTLREDDVVFSDGFEGTTTALWEPAP